MKGKLTGIRAVMAVGGVSLLLLVAACDDSGGATQDENSGVEADESGNATSSDEAADSPDAADDDAEGVDQAQDEEEGDSDATDRADDDVAAPDEDFDPCDAVDAADVADVTGIDVAEGESEVIDGATGCALQDPADQRAVLILWQPTDDDFDETVEEAQEDMEASETEDVSIAGSTRAVGLTGEMDDWPAAASVAQVDGGFIAVIVAEDGGDPSIDQAVDLVGVTLEQA